jgi:hypothetical protein
MGCCCNVPYFKADMLVARFIQPIITAPNIDFSNMGCEEVFIYSGSSRVSAFTMSFNHYSVRRFFVGLVSAAFIA